MKIKIMRDIPVQVEYKPLVGEVYKVKRFKWVNPRERLFFIIVNEEEVGIYENTECEVVEK